MRKFRFLASALAVTGTLAISGPVAAQYSAQPAGQPYQPQMAPTPTPDADALADAMRRLASDPRDVTALITAGELSLKVGDASGAAALFKRAEQVDPMNGRIKAGMARILVTQERPGEALRYFDQAVGYGLDPRSFAGDRGLAYDLIGQQERAQRDYRLALKGAGSDGSGDEVHRRYALSLAISGNQLGAFEQLEPLTRRNDRAAWRARAFVLAMTGDVPGANRIAQAMMPPAMAGALAPFFTRLPTLAPTDKAFAVHFGEVTPTPQRLADARLTPVLVALGPDPDARPTAIVVPSPPPQDPRARRGRRRSTPARVEVASAAPRPAAPVPTTTPAPGFGTAGQSPTDPVRTPATTAPVRTAASAPPTATTPVPQPLRPAPAPTQFARADVDPIQKATLADYERVQRVNEARARQSERAAQIAATKAASTPATQVAAIPSAPTTSSVAMTPPGTQPAPSAITVAAVPPSATPAAPTTAAPVGTQVAASIPSTTPPTTQLASTPAPAPAPIATPPSASPTSTAVPATQLAAAPPPATAISPSPSSTPTLLAANEDSILARIVQGLTIPGAELGVAAPPQPAPAAPAPVVAANVEPRPAPPPPASPPPPAVREAVARESVAKPPVVVATRATTRATTKAAPESATRTRSTPVEVADAAPTRRGARSRDTAAEEPLAPATRSGRRGAATRVAAADEPETPRTRSGRRTDTRTAARDEAEDAAPTRGKRGVRAVAAKDDDAAPAKGKGRGTRTAAADRKAEKPAGEPSRIWVQVAGGANEGDLGKAYNAVQSRTPALKGRAAYSTPLRATNRVVTGPFKTDAEARAFVNQLAKQGVSAFPFTSDKGQKMTKIPPK